MATLSTTLQALITIGSEDKQIDCLERELTGLNEVVADKIAYLVENAVTTYTTLWTDSQHAAATNPLLETFKKMFIVVDPDVDNSSALPIDVEIASTRHNSTTIDIHVVRIDRNTPLILTSIVSNSSSTDDGALFVALAATTTNYPRVTRIRVRNPSTATSGATNVKVRLLALK